MIAAESVSLSMDLQPAEVVSNGQLPDRPHERPTKITAFVVAFVDWTPLTLGLEGTFKVAIFVARI